MACTIAHLACLALLSVGARAEKATASTSMTLSVLQQAAFGAASGKHLRGKHQDPASQAITTLDTDHDGVIQPNEVAIFAADQGLDVGAVSREFAGLDSNKDGVLSTAEVATALQGVQAPATGRAPPAAMLAESDSEPWAVSTNHLHSSADDLEMEDFNDRAFSAVEVDEAGRGEVTLANSKSSESVAAGIVEDLKTEETQEAQARDLFRKSSEMRSKVISISESTKEKVMEMSAQAAHQKTDEVMHSLDMLSRQALEAEEKAAAYRAKAKMELKGARELMAAANSALHSRNSHA